MNAAGWVFLFTALAVTVGVAIWGWWSLFRAAGKRK
jgi:hypothetical protein